MNDRKHSFTDKAIALTYDGSGAPSVSAKGADSLAQKIIAIAKSHGVLIHQDAALTQVLSYLEIGDEIPESLYTCIATIIAFAYRLNNKHPRDSKK